MSTLVAGPPAPPSAAVAINLPNVGRPTICLMLALTACALSDTAARCQSATPGATPPPPGMSLAESAAKRFPQPVQVSALLRRDVLEPVESQVLLGTVQQIIRYNDGTLAAVIDYGGFLGFGTRPISVPIDAMVLVGQVMEIVAYTPKQLDGFPTFSAASATPLSPDTIIKVGLARPSH